MNERLAKMRDFAAMHGYAMYRQETIPEVAEQFALDQTPYVLRSALRLKTMLEAEMPVIMPEERIALFRTVKKIPSMFTKGEQDTLNAQYLLFDSGRVNNISADYGMVISRGLLARREDCQKSRTQHASDPEACAFLDAAMIAIDAVVDFCARLRTEAERQGKRELAKALENIPMHGARNFFEACQFFRILNFVLWINGNHHNTVGRFDQYMYPYFKKDIEIKRITSADALELITELFISLNKDTELYHGVQQGDNGQSLVLGGCKKDGSDAVNELTELCLRASLDLKLIDPKINLRAGKNTPAWLYELGTELTAKGLGFPQYENDDVVIPGLVKLGYDLTDARDYVVAACWEFIVPGFGMDIPNIDSLNFPKAVNRAVFEALEGCGTFEDFLQAVRESVNTEADAIITRFRNLFMEPAPFMSVCMDGCVEAGRDISRGCKYNNFGIHGAGLSTAADSLAAVEQAVYKENRFTKQELVSALKADFEGYDELRSALLFDMPKMGNNDDLADRFSVMLLDWFAEALKGRRNERGGIYRAGTGTAMYYLWNAGEVGATADGRKAKEPFGANFSPAIGVRPAGPLSVIQSFTKQHLSDAINGGPLTLELHDTLFRNRQGIEKTAQLVKLFIDRGGHQIQLNAVSRDTLLDAQKHPEQYRNLIVRVWGWSGYFVELDKPYQDHIISRVEFMA
jgi:formate C-acetyltransferase